jgi:hypothetical protein
MNRKVMLGTLVFLTGCPIAMAYDIPNDPKCVIDQCDEKTCSVETPEGWVDIARQPYYKEGKKITCPLWLIDPT